MKKLFERFPILRYLIESYIKFLLILSAAFTVLFAVLHFTGIYASIESALDLKYNSPFVLVPLYGTAALSVLCFVIGVLLYFYKYKRSKSQSKFYRAFISLLTEKQEEMDAR